MDDYIISTDGSTQKDKWMSCGKSGAAAVIYEKDLSGNAVAKLEVNLGSESNNYVAELWGINIGLKYVQSIAKSVKVLLMADCIPALENSFSSHITKDYSHIVNEIRNRLKHLDQCGVEIEATWVPGHSNFRPNEEADELANAHIEAAVEFQIP